MPEAIKIKIDNVRLSYCNVHVAQANKLAPEKPATFSTDGILPMDHPQLPEVKAAIRKVAQSMWGDNADAILKDLADEGRIAIKKGDKKRNKDGSPVEAYAGKLYIKAANKTRPLVLDANKAILTEKDGRPYSGCWGNLIVTIKGLTGTGPMAQAGKRIYAELNGVQFTRHDTSFGGGSTPSSVDEFSVVGADADATPPNNAGGAADFM